MRISAMWYVLKQGLKNIFRHKLFSLASVATIITCVFLFGACYSIVTNLNYMVKEAEDGVAITVFFDEGLEDADIEKIGAKIKAIDDVKDITFISAEEAWESFKQEYFANNEALAEGFEDDNPLANSANYQVSMKNVARQNEVCAEIKAMDGVRKVESSEILADTFTGVNSFLTYFSMAIISLLLIVSVFLISNTISVGVAVRKEEIAIMKLIGAKNSFVRAPFLIEGVILGLFGATVPLVVIYVLYDKLIDIVLNNYNVLANILKFLSVQEVFKGLAPLSLIIGVAVGYLGSLISIRKHLKV